MANDHTRPTTGHRTKHTMNTNWQTHQATKLSRTFKNHCQQHQAPCWLCGHPIHYTAPPTHPFSFETDHYHPRKTHPHSQTGVRSGTTGSTPPCNITDHEAEEFPRIRKSPTTVAKR